MEIDTKSSIVTIFFCRIVYQDFIFTKEVAWVRGLLDEIEMKTGRGVRLISIQSIFVKYY